MCYNVLIFISYVCIPQKRTYSIIYNLCIYIHTCIYNAICATFYVFFLNTSNPIWVTPYIMALYNNICILVRYAYYLNTSGYHVSGSLRGIFCSNEWFADQTLVSRGRAKPSRAGPWVIVKTCNVIIVCDIRHFCHKHVCLYIMYYKHSMCVNCTLTNVAM